MIRKQIRQRSAMALPAAMALLPMALAAVGMWAGGTLAVAAEAVQFNRDIRPLLSGACFHCHGPDAAHREADLRLDEAAGVQLAFGDGSDSEAWLRITSDDPHEQMPPPDSNKQLQPAEIALVKQWIEQGAEYQAHWSFVAPARPQPPEVKQADWPRNEIDRFVLSRLESENLSPSPEADRATLARRLYLDLIGLPPTPDEVEAFLADTTPDAYQRLVDRLLADKHHGERMALPWLDAARHADTNGFSIDDHRDVWAWRDWVINAYNNNMPYDQFITEQLAGDLLPQATVEQRVATGFLRNSMSTHEGGTLPEEYRVIYLADKVDTVATAMLGLTMRCAQCHDHKYDPISQEEFYRFYAYFDRAVEHGKGATNANTAPTLAVEPLIGDAAAMRDRLQQRVATLKSWQQRLSDKQARAAPEVQEAFRSDLVASGIALKTVNTEIGVLEKTIKDGRVTAMVMQEQPRPSPTYLLIRGAYDQPDKSKPLTPGTPAALPPLPDDAPPNRLGLANWLTRPDHPLTARVAVNRSWQMLFGNGLAGSVNDFGSQVGPPSHPELLDWLAVDFVENGWDTKRLIKQMVMSATYRQVSSASAELLARDPGNRLLARGARFRLPAELVRDNALAISGLLVRDVGGPSVYPLQPKGLWAEVSHYGYERPFTAQVFIPDTGEALRRRSMYTFWKRTSPPPSLTALDAPTREVCTVERLSTNTPLQALVLLNEPQFVDAARALAAATIDAGGGDDQQRVAFAFRRATLREPNSREAAVLLGRLAAARQKYSEQPDEAARLAAPVTTEPFEGLDPIEHAAWTVVCGVILNLDETISKE
ncbi:MAG: PSD1 and planctomycete cytochrome C domain-containing protein [Pirellulales bacterium]